MTYQFLYCEKLYVHICHVVIAVWVAVLNVLYRVLALLSRDEVSNPISRKTGSKNVSWNILGLLMSFLVFH